MDLEKEFSKKTSQNFYRRPSKWSAAEIIISGSHANNPKALSSDEVIRFMLGGQEEMKIFCTKKGFTGLDSISEFKIECRINENSDPYGDAYEEEYYFLIAVGPKP